MKAVILAGGLGQRLAPFTKAIPKPLLPIGEKSVLEIQILTLKQFGFTEFYIATYYMSDLVKAYLGDGSKWGVKVMCSQEPEPLGTCGPLSLLKAELTEPFLVINGDILTTLDLKKLYDFAVEKKADFTVVTKEHVTPFAFGRVFSKGGYIKNIEEKQGFKLEIIAGIYVMKPNVFRHIPDGKKFGIDELITEMLKDGFPIAKYLMKDYWIDIGQAYDYEKAQTDYPIFFPTLATK